MPEEKIPLSHLLAAFVFLRETHPELARGLSAALAQAADESAGNLKTLIRETLDAPHVFPLSYEPEAVDAAALISVLGRTSLMFGDPLSRYAVGTMIIGRPGSSAEYVRYCDAAEMGIAGEAVLSSRLMLEQGEVEMLKSLAAERPAVRFELLSDDKPALIIESGRLTKDALFGQKRFPRVGSLLRIRQDAGEPVLLGIAGLVLLTDDTVAVKPDASLLMELTSASLTGDFIALAVPNRNGRSKVLKNSVTAVFRMPPVTKEGCRSPAGISVDRHLPMLFNAAVFVKTDEALLAQCRRLLPWIGMTAEGILEVARRKGPAADVLPWKRALPV